MSLWMQALSATVFRDPSKWSHFGHRGPTAVHVLKLFVVPEWLWLLVFHL
jgi:hypothetical protein